MQIIIFKTESICSKQRYGVNAAKRDQIGNFIKNFFISEIDVNLII